MAAVAATASHIHSRSSGHRALGLASLGLAAVHLLVLALLPHNVWWVLALGAMTLWCFKCSWCVLRGGSPLSLLSMSALMGSCHVAMVSGLPWFAGHHHNHSGHAATHASLMLGIAVAEFLLMYGAAWLSRKDQDREIQAQYGKSISAPI